MRSIFHFILITIVILICAIPNSAQTIGIAEENRYLIPEVGIIASFPEDPVYSRPPASETNFQFSVLRHYESRQSFNDSATYFRHIGVYSGKDLADSSLMLTMGLGMNAAIFKNAGTTILLIEKCLFKGLPAYRLKAFSPGNTARKKSPFYVSMILFVRDRYLIELVIFNAQPQDAAGINDPFFDAISFSDLLPANDSMRTAITSLNCQNYLPCFYGTQQLIMSFPGAPRVSKKEGPLFKAVKYHLAAQDDTGTIIFYGLEFYTLDNTSDTSNLNTFPTEMPGNARQKLLSQREVTYYGQKSIETIIYVNITDKGVDKNFIINSLMFKHHHDIIYLFVYVKTNAYADVYDQCFFNCLHLW